VIKTEHNIIHRDIWLGGRARDPPKSLPSTPPSVHNVATSYYRVGCLAGDGDATIIRFSRTLTYSCVWGAFVSVCVWTASCIPINERGHRYTRTRARHNNIFILTSVRRRRRRSLARICFHFDRPFIIRSVLYTQQYNI